MNKYLFLILAGLSLAAAADHIPGHSTLEWGIGLAGLSTPDYVGSSHQQQELLPFPYIKYRGERLLVDEGIEYRLFKSPDLLLSVSGNGSLPSSENNPEREGMDELDATLEFGPSLEYRLSQNSISTVWFELPLRYSISINGSPDLVGRVIHPRLAWRKPAQHKYDWKLRFAAGPLFANADFHAYYYDVETHEATASRPVYRADGGYSGFRADFTYSKRLDGYWFGGFLRHDNLSESEIHDSPLVTTSTNWMAGIGFAWIISEK